MKNILPLLQNYALQMYFGNFLQEFREASHQFPGSSELTDQDPLQDFRLNPAKANVYLFLQDASCKARKLLALPENEIP